jgi:hypothetical protein
MPNIRIDIGCDICGEEHEIFVQSNRVGTARSYQFDCPKKHKPVLMPANAFRSLEAVPSIPAAGIIATVVE